MMKSNTYKIIDGFEFPPEKIDNPIEKRMAYYCSVAKCKNLDCNKCGFAFSHLYLTAERKQAFLKWEERENES